MKAALGLGAFALALAVVVASLAGAATAPAPRTDAAATLITITIPGQPPVSASQAASPATGPVNLGSYAYPPDGSVIAVGAASATASSQAGVSASARAEAVLQTIRLFGGEIAVDAVRLRSTVAAGSANATADVSASELVNVVVLDRPIQVIPGLQIPLAEWGTVDLLGTLSDVPAVLKGGLRSASAAVTGLRVRLVAPHGGLPPGTEIVVGSASASAVAQPAVQEPVAPPSPPPAPAAPVVPRPPSSAAGHEPGRSVDGAPPDIVRDVPDGVAARLSSGGYVFPIYGPASFGDTFGAPRADVVGGWHHGEDIFAPAGTPLLAVAGGTVFSVGWNDIGGWRLWLRDDGGNEFYYAHLSAYSPFAREGARVQAGTVLGFMGKTGDAEFSPPHLHFEIHPAPLLALGYDGAVAPYPFLIAWRRAEDVPFNVGRVFLAGSGGRPIRGAAPPAAAVLLQANDISGHSGLEPDGLERALEGGSGGGGTTLATSPGS